METEKTDEDDLMIIEEASTSTHVFRKPLPPMSSLKNQNLLEFPDDDFDFDDCDVVIKTKESERFPIHTFLFISFSIYIY